MQSLCDVLVVHYACIVGHICHVALLTPLAMLVRYCYILSVAFVVFQ